MHLSAIVDVHDQLRATTRRTLKVAAIAEPLARLDGDDLVIATAWLAGRPRQGRLGIGAAGLRSHPFPPPSSVERLTLQQVDAQLSTIATTRGKGANARRNRVLDALLAEATGPEQTFLIKLVLGELRQGALEALVVDGLAHAYGLPVDRVRRAHMLAGHLLEVASALAERGPAGLDRFQMTPFTPVAPMLASPAEAIGRALEAVGSAILDYKLDGARIQIHRDGDRVAVYTRTLREVSTAVPELQAAARALPVSRVILDGEALAVQADGRPYPFQVTMQRFGRKTAGEADAETTPLTPYFFDVLWIDGESLIDQPASERADQLESVVPAASRIPRRRTEDPTTVSRFFQEALDAGHEGIMVKDAAAPYRAGSRGKSWLKLKSSETLDLVVLAAEWGSGRRHRWLSNLHLGARRPDGTFAMLGKTFKGLTDAMLAAQTERFQALAVAEADGVVYLRPAVVVEISYDALQRSSHYPLGLALRFARVKRFRPDKTPEEADTVERVQARYRGGAP